jgi:hypothetical protein
LRNTLKLKRRSKEGLKAKEIVEETFGKFDEFRLSCGVEGE